ncbi:MAG: nucleotidyltransferase family protein [Lachnospiraceae bacterium]|nr:nucleotidyltransferase family protein [Lachnospiraceae bacterium]
MRVTGIICEYNPFHNGHKYHIEETRRICEADYIIGIMSGPFTQRGTPAITDKYSRAKMALLSGCDIVLELPVRFATSSAEGFAHGAVNILNATGITDGICFGTEAGILDDFRKVAEIIDTEPHLYKEILLSSLKNGLSYPTARSRALSGFLKTEHIPLSADISLPNNILAIEYIRACNHAGLNVHTVKRTDNGYHDLRLSDMESGMCSASALRNAVIQNAGSGNHISKNTAFHTIAFDNTIVSESSVSAFIPYNLYEYLSRPVSERHFSMQLYASIVSHMNSLPDYADISNDLAARIRKNITAFEDWAQFVSLLKTKQYTYTRIQRALSHCMLNIKNFMYETDKYKAPYIRVLGFRKSSSPLMKLLSQKAAAPVVTKPADVNSLNAVSDSYAKTLLSEDIYASELYEKTRSFTYEYNNQYNEFTHGMVIE